MDCLNSRPGVMIVGSAGVGKTTIWKTLLETWNIFKKN
jgi:adenylate kinase